MSEKLYCVIFTAGEAVSTPYILSPESLGSRAPDWAVSREAPCHKMSTIMDLNMRPKMAKLANGNEVARSPRVAASCHSGALLQFFVNALTSAVVTEQVPINTNFSRPCCDSDCPQTVRVTVRCCAGARCLRVLPDRRS